MGLGVGAGISSELLVGAPPSPSPGISYGTSAPPSSSPSPQPIMNVEREATANAVATYFVYFFSIFVLRFPLTGSINRPRHQRRPSGLNLREGFRPCNLFFSIKTERLFAAYDCNVIHRYIHRTLANGSVINECVRHVANGYVE